MSFDRPTFSEPRSDIEAQLTALSDVTSPKAAVFISRHNDPETFHVPLGCHFGGRANGRLICRDAGLAEWFASASSVTDEEMAAILGYPQSKARSMAHLCPVAVQVRNHGGAVIQECAVDAYDLDKSIPALLPYVGNGSMHFMTLASVIQRRVQLQGIGYGS